MAVAPLLTGVVGRSAGLLRVTRIGAGPYAGTLLPVWSGYSAEPQLLPYPQVEDVVSPHDSVNLHTTPRPERRSWCSIPWSGSMR